MVIERAEVGDAAAILALQRLAYQSEAEIYHDPALPPLVETLAELAAAFQTHMILKAVVNGGIAGSVRAYRDDRTCHIGRLMVHPRLQGQGIGTALMEQIEAHFADVEQYQLFTGVQSEANIRLYRRLGYATVGTRRISDRVSIAIMTKTSIGSKRAG